MSRSRNGKDAVNCTSLHANPFCLLGATTRDNRRRIVELAEEKSLILDAETCEKACATLLNPRSRLTAEIAWLPGLSPRKVNELLRALQIDIGSIDKNSLPVLPRANLTAAAFELMNPDHDSALWCRWIMNFAFAVNSIDSDEILRDINEDRKVSSFPEVKGIEYIEAELANRNSFYVESIKNTLNKFSPEKLVDVVTQVVNLSTNSGNNHAPLLIDDLIDNYEIETQSYLQREGENIEMLINAARNAAPAGANHVTPVIDRLEEILRKWSKIARPVQVSKKARGMNHDLSQNLAFNIRSLGIDLFNKHGMLGISDRIVKIIRDVFDKLPEVVQYIEKDLQAVQDLTKKEIEAQNKEDQWAKDIFYEAEVGLIFKGVLRISPKGVRWKETIYPLEDITRVRWGGISHSVNGIPTGTTYTIAFGDNHSETVVELRNQEIYSAFIDKLWRAVCGRLMVDILEVLRDGKSLTFGGVYIDNRGVQLTKHNFLTSEKVYYIWPDVNIWSNDGNFFIGAKDNRKVYSSISYISSRNTHILETVLRMRMKQGKNKLSDLLNG